MPIDYRYIKLLLNADRGPDKSVADRGPDKSVAKSLICPYEESPTAVDHNGWPIFSLIPLYIPLVGGSQIWLKLKKCLSIGSPFYIIMTWVAVEKESQDC